MILILDDEQSRINGFKSAIKQLPNKQMKSWSNAPAMISEVKSFLPKAKLISLDHDLYKLQASDPESGTGRDIAEYLANHKAICPIIIHSTNIDASWGMYNVLVFSGWKVTMLHYTDKEWFNLKWLPVVKILL